MYLGNYSGGSPDKTSGVSDFHYEISGMVPIMFFISCFSDIKMLAAASGMGGGPASSVNTIIFFQLRGRIANLTVIMDCKRQFTVMQM